MLTEGTQQSYQNNAEMHKTIAIYFSIFYLQIQLQNIYHIWLVYKIVYNTIEYQQQYGFYEKVVHRLSQYQS